MSECDPADSVEMLYFADPPLIVTFPSVVLPSLKVTLPVAVAGVSAAVKVTVLPYVDGFNEEVSVTEDKDFPNIIPVSAIKARRGTIRNTGRSIIHSRRILGFLRRCNLSAGHKSPVFGTTLPMPTIKNLIERQPCAPDDRFATAS